MKDVIYGKAALVLFSAASLLAASASPAQTIDAETRQSMIANYTEAQTLFDAGDFEQAKLKVFEVVQMGGGYSAPPSSLNLFMMTLVATDDLDRARLIFNELAKRPVTPAIAENMRAYAPRLGLELSPLPGQRDEIASRQNRRKQAMEVARATWLNNDVQLLQDREERRRVAEAKVLKEQWERDMEQHRATVQQANLAREKYDTEREEYERKMAEWTETYGEGS